MEPFEVLGTWWFAGEEENGFEAQLRLTNEHGIVLTPTNPDRFRHIITIKFGSKNDFGTYSICLEDAEVLLLVGKGASDGYVYSLHYCLVNTGIVRAGYLTRGRNLLAATQDHFEEYSISFSGLSQWGATNGFNRQQVGNTVTVTYDERLRAFESIEVPLEKAIVKIRQLTKSEPDIAKLILQQNTEFLIISQSGSTTSVTEAIEYYSNMLRNFLMLATREYVKPSYLRGRYLDGDSSRYVDIFWIGKGFGLPSPTYGIGTWVFKLDELGKDLEIVLRKWEENRKQLNPFTRNYFANRYLQSTYLEINFVTYVQALEAHHKKRNPDFKCIRGESCLKQRLVDILNVNNAVTDIRNLVGSDNSEFAQIVVNVRNDLTHEADLKIPPYELGDITRRLEVIILLTMYVVLQFPHDLIESAKKRLLIGLANWDARD